MLTGILNLVLEAFKGYNQGWLCRAANLVEAHRARESLEVGRWGLCADPVQAGRASLPIGSDVNKWLSPLCIL